ncbi:MAG: hypothetical protein ABJE95_27400, partial [Byssovorax sp.]
MDRITAGLPDVQRSTYSCVLHCRLTRSGAAFLSFPIARVRYEFRSVARITIAAIPRPTPIAR